MTASDAGRTPKEEDTMGTHTGECIYEQRLRQATQRADTLATRLEQEQTAGNRLVEFVTGVQAQRDDRRPSKHRPLGGCRTLGRPPLPAPLAGLPSLPVRARFPLADHVLGQSRRRLHAA
jgi:hypothetical protein